MSRTSISTDDQVADFGDFGEGFFDRFALFSTRTAKSEAQCYPCWHIPRVSCWLHSE
jgi:hypothetical protein